MRIIYDRLYVLLSLFPFLNLYEPMKPSTNPKPLKPIQMLLIVE